MNNKFEPFLTFDGDKTPFLLTDRCRNYEDDIDCAIPEFGTTLFE